METLAPRGRQHKEEVPVHGDGDGALVVLPRRVQVCAGQVGSIEPPCSLGGDRVEWRYRLSFINFHQHQFSAICGSDILPSL